MFISVHSFAIFLAYVSSGYGLQSPGILADTPLAALIDSAKSHLAKGSPRDALVYFDAAVSRDPTNYLTVFQRGAAYLSIGNDAQAADDFDRVLELKPGFEGALLQRARIKTRSGDWIGARGDLEDAGKRSSTEYDELEEAHAAARTAEAAEKKGDWETCIAQAGTAIVKAPMAPSLRQTRARCRFERGDIQEGISDLGHVLQILPGLGEPHLQISSMLFYALRDIDRGVAQIRKCLHSDPDSKVCGRLFRREKQLARQIEQVSGFMERRKFSSAVDLLVGTDEAAGLIVDVKQDVKEAMEAGYIHRKAPEDLYYHLVEKTCEAYRAVCGPCPGMIYIEQG
jgi:DnaJ homolog subfamily C member 3